MPGFWPISKYYNILQLTQKVGHLICQRWTVTISQHPTSIAATNEAPWRWLEGEVRAGCSWHGMHGMGEIKMGEIWLTNLSHIYIDIYYTIIQYYIYNIILYYILYIIYYISWSGHIFLVCGILHSFISSCWVGLIPMEMIFQKIA